jgi:hypothetical protein
MAPGTPWCDDGIHRVNEHGDAELGTVGLKKLSEEGTDELARSGIYTWQFVKIRSTGPLTCSQEAQSRH